jgi:hypothetical protein
MQANPNATISSRRAKWRSIEGLWAIGRRLPSGETKCRLFVHADTIDGTTAKNIKTSDGSRRFLDLIVRNEVNPFLCVKRTFAGREINGLPLAMQAGGVNRYLHSVGSK